MIARKSNIALIAISLSVMLSCLLAPAGSALADECPASHSLLQESGFDDGKSLPWNISESKETNSDFDLVDGEYCVTINDGGAQNWDVQIRHRQMKIEQGHTYTVGLTARSTKNTDIYVKIGDQGDPYDEYWNNGWSSFSLTANTPLVISDTFTMSDPDQPLAEFAIHMGGSLTGAVPLTICFDNMVLDDPDFIADCPAEDVELFSVRVNQEGYLPNAAKRATVVHASTSPLDWTLQDAANTTVASGTTTVFGPDSASGDHVHHADFSSYTTEGEGYTLVVDGEASHPFDIGTDIYHQLKYDALAYFYHNRSGVAIEMPYAGTDNLTRPAGHLPDVVTNPWPGLSGSSYTLDITKGWYDAGDHGKYVVNGGISVWTMMNQYERFALQGESMAPFADGAMNIPENSNGYPDILDEARWQLEMLLKMQVPAGQSDAGMVHHKAHDENWTPLGVAPHEDPEDRYLRPVSTAATLNLAAVAAQGARIWEDLDADFAAQCLTAAEIAWQAALANPTIYAPEHKDGGGPYNDDHVTDEFYWAAAELFATTGKAEYATYLRDSEYFLKLPSVMTTGGDAGLNGPFTWSNTDGLGTVTLALIPNDLTVSEVQTARDNIQAAAQDWLTVQNSEGYLVPIQAGDNGYPWGSNSFLLNMMVVMGLAHDFSDDDAYVHGMLETMDYLLGRNAMDQSYITGYGERPLEHPHHRFWANQVNPDFPSAPAGAVSGGPNSGLEDSWARGAGLEGCAPQKCFIDHIESWATNEITINWNAPLAWAAAYLDEQAGNIGAPELPTEKAGYRGGLAHPVPADIAATCQYDAADYGVTANDASDDTQGIRDALAAMSNDSSIDADHQCVLQLPAGTIIVSDEIRVEVDGVIINGTGTDPDNGGTKILVKLWEQYTVSSENEPNITDEPDKIWPGKAVFRVETSEDAGDGIPGSINFPWKGVNVADGGGGTVGDMTVNVSSTSKFSVGQTVLINAADTTDWLNSIYVPEEYQRNQRMRSQMNTITAINTSTNELTLDAPLEIDMPYRGDYNSKVVPMQPVKDVGFANFMMEGSLEDTQYAGTANAGEYDAVSNPQGVAHRYQNAAPAAAIHNILFKGAQDGWVDGVKMYMSGSHTIVTEFARHLTLQNNDIDGAWNKGKGGHGYFRGSKLYDSLFKNNKLRNIRHLAIQWSATNNIIDGNDIDCDLNVHGGWEHNNLFRNNSVRIPFEHRSWTEEGPEDETWYPIWWAASPHASKWAGPSGFNNQFVNNTLSKQKTVGGEFEAWGLYDTPNVTYIFGGDNDAGWDHLATDGAIIPTWDPTTCFYCAPNTGVTTSEAPSIFTVAKRGDGQGTITVDDGVSPQVCGTACSSMDVDYIDGASYDFTAEADSSSLFSGWENPEGSPVDDITYVMENSIIVAYFDSVATPTPTPEPTATPTPEPTATPEPTVTPEAGCSISVTTAAQLSAALNDVAAGQVICLQDGTYVGNFVAAASGTASAPITLRGSSNAILEGFSIDVEGYVLYLNGVEYWNLEGFTVQGGQKGIILDTSHHCVLDDLTVKSTGHEAVHFRTHSTYNVIKNSSISDTGLDNAGFGEGVYIGSANSNWCTYTDCAPDLSHYNEVRDNYFGPNIRAEGVDAKEGTLYGVIDGNTFDGSGVSGINYADSWIDIKANNYSISNNTGINPEANAGLTRGFHVVGDQGGDQYGDDNHFVGNSLDFNGTCEKDAFFESGVTTGNTVCQSPGNTVTLALDSGCDFASSGFDVIDCSDITPTPTPEPTATPTVEPTVTPTATPTVEPTVTPTATPTVEPTVTPTPGTDGDLTILYRAGNTSDATNGLKPYFQITNSGSTSIDLADVTIGYWFTHDGNASLTLHCDYSPLGCENISGAFSAVSGGSTADTKLTVSLSAGTGTLAPGETSDKIQLRINRSDWADMDQTNDYSFDASMTSFGENTKVTGYLNGALTFGTEPSGGSV